MKNSLKKGFAIAVSVMTALWSVGIAAFAPVSAAAATEAAQSAGDQVKASLPAVYHIGSNGKRYVYPNQKTWDTWWADFSAVQTITDSALAAIAIGGNVTYRPGARLVKITTDPKVYMVGAGAHLHSVPDEATAMNFFGSDWNQKIDDVPDAFFTNYSVGSGLTTAALGVGGKLPVGTVVAVQGTTDYYFVGESELYMVGASDSARGRLNAVVWASDMAELESWVGTVPASPMTMSLDSLATPDRTGTAEGGTAAPSPVAGVTATVKQKSTRLSMASAQSQNAARTEVEICSDTAITIDGMSASSATGTVGYNLIQSWWQIGSAIYELTGTSAGDTVGEYTNTDTAASVPAGGCATAWFHSGTSANSGLLDISLTELMYTTTGSAAAATATFSGKKLRESSVVAVAATDLADIAFSSPTPAGGTTLQTDGTLQKVFGVQANISNNDMYIPNVVFKLSGSLSASNCELRINGTVVSTTYEWHGQYIVFEIPEASRVMDEGTDTWELWCKVNGEAGQTVTPQVVWPAPFFWFFDNVRVVSAGTEAAVAPYSTSKEQVAPSVTRMSVSTTAPLNLAGASITLEVINLNNVDDGTSGSVALDDEKTSGSTNTVVAVFKAKVRGSKATLTSLNLINTGANAAKGFSNCQIRIGQRNDKGEISTTSVNLANFALSNFGAEVNVLAVAVTVTATKQMPVGDWLIVIECDIVTAGAAYVNGDTLAMNLGTGAAGNITFDVGTTATFPAGNTPGTTITIRLLATQLGFTADLTGRFLVSNASDTILGVFPITGATQEGANVTSVAITFAAGVSGTAGCTTVTLKNGTTGAEIATSQSLTGAGTLTFSVTFTVPKNTQYLLHVVCVQASGAVTPATVAGATTLATVSGTGASSSQSFTATPGTVGATVTVAASGTVTAALGTNQPNIIIGPSEQRLGQTITLTASIHEDQSVTTLTLNLVTNDANADGASDGASSGTFAINEMKTVEIKADGFTVNGTAAAAATSVCTRQVTGASVTCNFSDGDLLLPAGQTGSITYYLTGNSLGNIGLGTAPATDTIRPTVVPSADITVKGDESQVSANPAGAVVVGRNFTPAGATLQVVSQALSSTTQPGQVDMELAIRQVIVGGTNITLNQVAGQCLTNDAANVCRVGTDVIDLVLDDTVIAGAQALAGAAPVTYTHAGLTNLVSVGTHELKSRVDGGGCSTGDTVQLTTNDFSFTVGGQTFATAQTVLVPNFTKFAAGNMTHPSNLCG